MYECPCAAAADIAACRRAVAGDLAGADRPAVGGDDAHDVVLLEDTLHAAHADGQQAHGARAAERIESFAGHVHLPFGESFRVGDPLLDARDGVGRGEEAYIPQELRQAGEGEAVKVDLNRPMKEILAQLSQYPVSTRLSLTGTIIVGRDIAHAKLKELIDAGKELPQYIKDHPIYYAGPAKTPAGYPSGSLGPTTAGRMDSYVDLLQSHGGSMIMLAKGNRSQQVTDACHKHGGFYLGSIGGPAAVLAQQSIKHLECVAYPELGMEAIWKIEVEDFPAFILVDDKGNDFFQQIVNKQCANCTK